MKTPTLYSIPFFLFENQSVYEITWKNNLERGRSQMTIWRMCIACWIPKATNTHSEYVILIAFPLQQWLHERVSVLRYTYIVCLDIRKIFHSSSFLSTYPFALHMMGPVDLHTFPAICPPIHSFDTIQCRDYFAI